MKRFTETGKWSKEWFQDLTPVQKCLWYYITENCDPAGVFDGNFKMMTFCIGEKVTEDTLEAFGGRIEKISNGKFWIVDFIEFQYGKLSKDCRPQQKVFASIEKHKLTDRVFNSVSDTLSGTPGGMAEDFQTAEKFLNSNTLSDTLSTSTDRVFNTLEEEEEEEYKEEEKDEGGVGETEVIDDCPEPEPEQIVSDEIFLPEEELTAAFGYLKTSRASQFVLMRKNYGKTESEIQKLLRAFLEQKLALNQYRGKTQKELMDNFYWWLPKHLNHEPTASQTARSGQRKPKAGKVQSLVNLASKVHYRG